MTYDGTPRISAASSFERGFCGRESRRLVLAAAILGSALGFIDGSIVSIAMPAMRATLGATLTQAQWINNAYMLPVSALILVGGAMGDRFGTGRVFSAGILLFMAASLASAAAPTAETLIAARALKGIGAAAMIPGSLALIYRAYPPEERGAAIGIWAGASALTTALGPVLGGLALTFLGDHAWRWLFAINLPLGTVAIWLLARSVQQDPARADAGLDIPGAVLASAALGSIAWALTVPAGAPAMVPGLILMTAFLLWEHRARHPMIPLGLFAFRSFSSANLATFLLYFALSAVLFYLPMTVISGWGVSPAETAAAFIPLTAFIALFSSRAGRAADRRGPSLLIATGAGIVALAFAGLGLTAHLQSFWGVVMPLMALFGLGMCLVVAPLSAAVMGAVPEASAGAASGINNAVSRAAGLVAVAAMGAVAAAGYAGAAGPLSFGAEANGPGHAEAMNAGFRLIALVTAGLALVSSVVAWAGIGRNAQAGS